MAYKLELHIVATGDDQEQLDRIQKYLVEYVELGMEEEPEVKFELAGSLVEITDGEENSEGVPDGE